MSKRTLGIAAAFVVGIVWMLAAAPAQALCSFSCTCESSCSEICFTGPFIQDCPECNQSTCGEWGVCSTSWSCDETPAGCPAQECTTNLTGTAGNDTLNGGSGRECIYGYGGNDTIDGNAGDDTIYCGPGTDTAYGDSGNDCLFGEGDGDYLDGESGSDLADGGAGSDTCIAESKVSCP